MANNRIDKINVGGADYDLGSTNFVFDTYAEYQAAYTAGNIPVGSVVYIKEGSTDNTITALQVVYNNGTVKSALDELNNDLTNYVRLDYVTDSNGIAITAGNYGYYSAPIPTNTGYHCIMAFSSEGNTTSCVPCNPCVVKRLEDTSLTFYFRNVTNSDVASYKAKIVFLFVKDL